MRLFVRVTRVLLISVALAFLVSVVARPLTAQAQTSAPAPVARSQRRDDRRRQETCR